MFCAAVLQWAESAQPLKQHLVNILLQKSLPAPQSQISGPDKNVKFLENAVKWADINNLLELYWLPALNLNKFAQQNPNSIFYKESGSNLFVNSSFGCFVLECNFTKKDILVCFYKDNIFQKSWTFPWHFLDNSGQHYNRFSIILIF